MSNTFEDGISSASDSLTQYDCSISSLGFLSVKGKEILPSIDPNELRTILIIGQTVIKESIENIFERTVIANPGALVVRPSIGVLRFGSQSQRKRILSKEGDKNDDNVHRNIIELKGRFHPHWNAISEGGFKPEVRSSFNGPNIGGIWLMLRALED